MISHCHRLLFPCLAGLILAGCSSSPEVKIHEVPHYRMDVQQGNVVTQAMVSRLKPGMTKSQVRFIMGTPLLTDVFHKDRWDYVYRYVRGGVVASTLTEERRVTLFFENDLLKRVEGDVVAAKDEAPAEASPSRPADAQAPASPPVKEADSPLDKPADSVPPREEKEKGFFDSVLEKIGL
jgi:outer membrane protein assembly factor BamE